MDDAPGVPGASDAPADASRLRHELKSRAAVVAGFATLVADEVADLPLETAQSHLERLARNVEQMGALVTSLHEMSMPQSGSGPSPAASRPLTRQQLLVVEDDDDQYDLLTALLAHRPRIEWDVRRATSLAEACAAVRDSNPACAVVDLTLPDAALLEALVTLRAQAPDLPIIVVTGVDDSGVGVEAVRRGAQDYLIKGDLDADSLERAITYAIERSRVEWQLAHQALHDSLTGLPNRALLLERLRLALGRIERTQATVAVFFIDLDRFKVVNDSLGHNVGDELLVAVADRLGALVRRADTVARFGGDEFIVLVENLADADEAIRVAEHLLSIFEKPFACRDGEHWLGASVGVATARTSQVAAESLLTDADAAMYRAKEGGKGRYELFDDSIRASLVARLETERALVDATRAGELLLHYQPLVDLDTGETIGVEALLRWNSPERGLQGPSEFLAVAEESGQIIAIGAWVLLRACADTRRWLDAGLVGPEWTTWVNVSSRQLEHPGLAEAVGAALTISRLPAVRLGLEITEGALVLDHALADILQPLHDSGIKLAIDDFGTGFSSLQRLRHLPFDHLKVDGSFVRGMSQSAQDAAIVRTCVHLADAMGLVSVAEGVETEEQRDALRVLGCRVVQGFGVHRPMPTESLELLLAGAATTVPVIRI
ncbi:MAG TPA: GGDEF domain-containing response regulator [Mycobacteriales bacterium]|nr:GGDEF domain-containing response regulator [Mycobacteriales bacterium]